jgi:inosose dehydratase
VAVEIGINPNSWTLDDVPELRHFTSLEDCLSEAGSSGYAGIEMGGIFPRSAVELRPLLEVAGLRLVSGWHDGKLLERGPEAEFRAVLPFLEFLKEMGCRVIVYADVTGASFGDPKNPMSLRPKLGEGDWAGYGAKATQLAERMADFGVAMAFHHHIGTFVETDQEVDRLMATTGPAVGLLLDSGHSLLAGGNPLDLARRHCARINHVHCKDVRAEVMQQALAQDMSFVEAVLAGVYTVPGDGCIDFASILAVLAGGGYRGWLVVEAEQDPRKAPPLEYAELGFANLRRLAEGAGFLLTDRPTQRAG